MIIKNLVFDIGNTNIVIALCTQTEIIAKWRLHTKSYHTADSYFALIKTLLDNLAVHYQEITNVIIGSVVPGLDNTLSELSIKYFKCTPFFILEEESGIKHILKIGADRVANIIESMYKWPNKPLLIIDIGTATTLDALNEKGEYLGGVIAPGPEIIIDAFSKSAALLHSTSLKKPEKVLARSLAPAMHSGMFFGYLGLLNNLVEKILYEEKMAFTIIVTGGLAEVLGKELEKFNYIEPDLTIYGLLKIFYKINK